MSNVTTPVELTNPREGTTNHPTETYPYVPSDNDELTWASLSSKKLTKAQQRKASIILGHTLVRLKIAQNKHEGLIVKVPCALFEDVIEQPEDDVALMMVFTAVHEGYEKQICSTLTSLIVTEQITPVKTTRPVRRAAIEALTHLETLSLGSSLCVQPAPKPVPKPAPKVAAPSATTRKRMAKPVLSDTASSSSSVCEDDSSEESEDSSDHEGSVRSSHRSLRSSQRSRRSSTTAKGQKESDHRGSKEFDHPSVCMNPDNWKAHLTGKRKTCTSTEMTNALLNHYQNVKGKNSHNFDLAAQILKYCASGIANDNCEAKLLEIAFLVRNKLEFWGQQVTTGDTEVATAVQNELNNTHLPKDMRLARKVGNTKTAKKERKK